MSVEAFTGKIEGMSTGPRGDSPPVPYRAEEKQQTPRGPITLFSCQRFNNTTGMCERVPGVPIGPCKIIELYSIPRYNRQTDEAAEGSDEILLTRAGSGTLELNKRNPNILLVNDKEIQLLNKEALCAESLIRANGETVSKEQLYMDSHPDAGYLPKNYAQIISMTISRLKAKLDPQGSHFIKNIYGGGYRVDTPEIEIAEQADSLLAAETIGGSVRINKNKPKIVQVNNIPMRVSQMEFLLVQRLMEAEGKPVLLEKLYKDTHPDEESIPENFHRALRTQVTALRKTFKRSGITDVIETTKGGYRMNTPEEPPEIPQAEGAVIPENLRVSYTVAGTVVLNKERKGKIWINDTQVAVTPNEFKIVEILMGRDTPILPEALFEMEKTDKKARSYSCDPKKLIKQQIFNFRRKLRRLGFGNILNYIPDEGYAMNKFKES